MRTKEKLVRSVRWEYPDGTGGSKTEVVEVEIEWPIDKPQVQDSTYFYSTEWRIARDIGGA